MCCTKTRQDRHLHLQIWFTTKSLSDRLRPTKSNSSGFDVEPVEGSRSALSEWNILPNKVVTLFETCDWSSWTTQPTEYGNISVMVLVGRNTRRQSRYEKVCRLTSKTKCRMYIQCLLCYRSNGPSFLIPTRVVHLPCGNKRSWVS